MHPPPSADFHPAFVSSTQMQSSFHFKTLPSMLSYASVPSARFLTNTRQLVNLPGYCGKAGLSDLTRSAELPKELEGLLALISCIADAQPVQKYLEWFTSVGLVPRKTESHDEALHEMVRQVQAKLLGAEVLAGLKKIDLPGVDFSSAKKVAATALSAVQQGHLGYALITAEKER
jgi:hypothetical protein